MAGPIRISVLANASQARREVTSFSGVAKKALGTLGLALGGAAVVQGVKSVVKATSDAQQSVGATETIYGKYAASVVKKSNQAAKAVGLSANSYRELANTTGALLSNQGINQRKLSGSTDKLIRQAADLAATFGGTTKEAVEALTSAYKGEFDPIERYGISLKQSAVNTEALRVANVKSVSQFNKLSSAQQAAAKRQATANILTKQSARAQGQFGKETGTLAHQQQVLAAQADNLKVKLGNILLPAITDLAKKANADLIPALSDAVDWLRDNKDEISDFGNGIKQDLLPPLKLAAKAVQTAVKIFRSLPGPLQEIAVKAALAAYALPKITRAVAPMGAGFSTTRAKLSQFNAELSYSETRSAAVGRAAYKLGEAAKGAAGIGGMLALSDATGRTNKTLGTLEGAAGGALLGFSVGGPWGAAIGGGAGALYALATATKKSSDALVAAKPPAADYAAALDQVTGAINRSTRASAVDALQKGGAFEAAQKLGIGSRDLVGDLLGQEGATKRVDAAMAKASQKTAGWTDQYGAFHSLTPDVVSALATVNSALGNNSAALNKDQAALRQRIIANGQLDASLKSIKGHSHIVSTIETKGWPETSRQLAQLSLKYRLTPKQVTTLIRATGAKATVKDVLAVQKQLKATGNTKANLGQYASSVKSGVNKAAAGAKSGGANVKKAAEDGPKKARGTMPKYISDITSSTSKAKGRASSGGHAVGGALKSGTLAGVGGLGALLSGSVSAAVNAAIAAGRRAADAHSPSRKMKKLGKDMGDGLVQGTKAKHAAAAKAGKALVLAMTGGSVKGGSEGISKALDYAEKVIKANTKDKKEKAVLALLTKQSAALKANGKLQDAVNARLDDAKSKLADLVQQSKDYAGTVRQSVLDYGSVISLGQDTGFGSAAQLVTQLQDKVAQAQKYAAIIASLTKAGLNQTTLQQLIDAGVEGGLGTAQTLLDGGTDIIKQVNALTSQLDVTGTAMGNATANTFYASGIKAAQGLVAGLASQQAALDKQAVKLGSSIAAAVKKALGIHSPSRVMQDIGLNTVKGLSIGLDDTYVKRPAQQLAATLTKSFGTPELQAYATAAGTTSAGGNTYQITLQVPVGASSADIGRTLVSHIAAFEDAGGRRKA